MKREELVCESKNQNFTKQESKIQKKSITLKKEKRICAKEFDIRMG